MAMRHQCFAWLSAIALLAIALSESGTAVAATCKAADELRRLDAVPRSANTLRIATFNIRILSSASRDECELAYIAGLVRGFDVVAIQELRDIKALDRLRKALDEDKVVKVPKDTWQAEVSKPVGRGVKELYAFLYREDRVEVIAKGRLVADRKDRFIREPYFASFRAGQDEFTLLSIHALYKSKNAPERRLEFAALADEFGKLRRKQPTGRRLILVGDFNDPPGNARFAETLLAVRSLGCRLAEGPEIRTTIGDKSLYDNVCYLGAGAAGDPVGRDRIDKFDRSVFGCDPSLSEAKFDACLKRASKAVSDHRPVWFDLPFRPAEE